MSSSLGCINYRFGGSSVSIWKSISPPPKALHSVIWASLTVFCPPAVAYSRAFLGHFDRPVPGLQDADGVSFRIVELSINETKIEPVASRSTRIYSVAVGKIRVRLRGHIFLVSSHGVWTVLSEEICTLENQSSEPLVLHVISMPHPRS